VKIIQPESFYPEGPVFKDGRLYYVEYARHRVMCWDGHTHRPIWERPGCGPASVIPAPDGSLLVACYDEHCLARISMAGETLEIHAGDAQTDCFRFPNDFTEDGQGGIYFTASGEFRREAPVEGSVFYLSPVGRVWRVASGIHFANELAFDPAHGRLLVAEHFQNRLLSYEVLGRGWLAREASVFADLGALAPLGDDAEGCLGPDGIELDPVSGMLYVAHYGGGRVLSLRADGALEQEIPVPARFVTNVFPHQGRLYITAFHDAKQAPYVGGVYCWGD